MFRDAVIEEVLRGARRDGESPYRVRESESGDVDSCRLTATMKSSVVTRENTGAVINHGAGVLLTGPRH